MTDPLPSSKQLAFGDLLLHLSQRGFTVSPEHHLRLQQLLNRLKSDCSPEDLKTLLCPIFATSAEQQANFYKAFDDLLPIFNDEQREARAHAAEASAPYDAASPQSSPQTVRGVRRLVPMLLLCCAVIALVGLSYLAGSRRRASLTRADTANLGELEQRADETELPQAGGGSGGGGASEGGESAGNAASQKRASAETALVEMGVPSPTGSRDFTTSELKYETFRLRYGRVLRLGLIVAPLVFFFLYEAYRFRRRTLVLDRQRGKKPPFVWPVHIHEARLQLSKSERFYQTVRSLTRRQFMPSQRIDPAATVYATAKTLGYFSVRYQTATNVPEYLVLIDRRSSRDHLAQFFTELIEALEAEGVQLDRYYFDTDPRVCFSPHEGASVQLEELLHKYSGRRLLLFTDAEGMINPVSGRLEGWTSIFEGPRPGAILTPTPLPSWSVRERELTNRFVVLPCTLAGLSSLADNLGEGDPSDAARRVKEWTHDYPGAEAPGTWQSVPQLRRYLDEDVFRWLCACAIYPELHWDLTLFLSSLPFIREGTVNEPNVLRLFSLPCFRDGIIPEQLRRSLIRELSRDDELAARRAILGVLEKNPPHDETFAADSYRLNLVVNRWLVRPSLRSWLEVRKALDAAPRKQLAQDLTLVQFAEVASPFAFILPRRFYGVFFRRGFPTLGLRTAVRFLFCLALALGLWGVTGTIPTSPTYFNVEQSLVGHTGGISALAFAPTGKLLATAGADNQIILWEAEKDRWRPIRYFQVETPTVSAVAVSGSGKFVAGVVGNKSAPDKVSVWQTSPPRLLWQTELPPPVRAILFSPTDNWLVIAHQDNVVTLLVAQNGTFVKRLSSPAVPVSSLTLSADVSTLGASTSANESARGQSNPAVVLWNPFESSTKQQLTSREGICSLALMPNGETLIAGGDGGNVQLWNVRSGEATLSFDAGGAGVCSVTPSDEGRAVAGVNRNNVLTIWDTTSGEVQLVHQLGQAGNVPTALSSSNDGSLLVAGEGKDSTVRVWRIRDKTRSGLASLGVTALDGQHANLEMGIAHTAEGGLMWVDINGNTIRKVAPSDPVENFFIHGLQDAQDDTARDMNRLRMQLYFELLKEWGDRGINGRVSEIFLEDLRDVRVHLAGTYAGIEVRLGATDFGPRLENALKAIDLQQTSRKISYVDASQGKRLVLGTASR